MADLFDGGLFKTGDFALDEDKRIINHPPSECLLTKSGGTSEAGNIFDMFDNDATTFFKYILNITSDNADITFTITLDFLRTIRNRVLWIYYGAQNSDTSARAPFSTVSLQISTDGASWTTIDTIPCPHVSGGNTQTKTYTGANIKFRYLRFSTRAQSLVGSGTQTCSCIIYEIWASVVE